MGHDAERGREYHLRNIVYSRVSSFEVNVWEGFKDTMRSMPRRAKAAFGAYVPFVVAGYLLYDWMEKENWRSHRKDPKMFENDE